MKIAILGYIGAGKSTLARKIASKYDIPVLHLDKVNFTNNMKIRENTESREIVEDFMTNDSWVIDGNYSKFEQDRRIKEADKIIFLDFSRHDCLKRVKRRYKENKAKDEYVRDKFDLTFIKWILFDGRDRKTKERYSKIIEQYKDKTIICRNEKEVNELLERI